MLNVRNTGDVAGSEVVQVYVGRLPVGVETPPKALAGFKKVDLGPRRQTRVIIELDPKALSYWDANAGRWVRAVGTVPVFVGSSSADIRLTGEVRLKDRPGRR